MGIFFSDHAEEIIEQRLPDQQPITKPPTKQPTAPIPIPREKARESNSIKGYSFTKGSTPPMDIPKNNYSWGQPAERIKYNGRFMDRFKCKYRPDYQPKKRKDSCSEDIDESSDEEFGLVMDNDELELF